MGAGSLHYSPSIRHQSQTSKTHHSYNSSRTNSGISSQGSGYIPLSKYPSSSSSYSAGADVRSHHSITGTSYLDGLVSPTKTQSWTSRDNNIRRQSGYVTAQEHSQYVDVHDVDSSEIGKHHDPKDKFGVNYSGNNKATAGYISEGIQSNSTTSLASTISDGQKIANSKPQSYAGVSPFQSFKSVLGNVFRLNSNNKESGSVPQYQPAKMSRKERREQKIDAGTHWTDKIDNFYKRHGLG